ncbi:MAG TPA: hypothetical protein VMW85_03160 [Methanomassiliicoccales archaeon]|nr:hypothetical protein [Methanomassiliicoccales archaeon]
MEGVVWKEKVVRQWKAERDSVPSKNEKELWPRTISELNKKLKVEDDRSKKGDLYHRLVIALIKIEDYASALKAVEDGLGQGFEGWEEPFLREKAKVLYLLGREEEALTLMGRFAPQKKVEVDSEPPKYAPFKLETEVRLVCPDCGKEVMYGAKNCPSCGKEVGEGFRMVRRPIVSRNIDLSSFASQTAQDGKGPSHRIKEFNIMFSTVKVDHDDPEHFITTTRHRVFGFESISITEKRRFVKIVFFLTALINLLFLIGTLAALNNAWGAEKMIAWVVTWAALALPTSAIFLWLLWPPSTNVQGT